MKDGAKVQTENADDFNTDTENVSAFLVAKKFLSRVLLIVFLFYSFVALLIGGVYVLESLRDGEFLNGGAGFSDGKWVFTQLYKEDIPQKQFMPEDVDFTTYRRENRK